MLLISISSPILGLGLLAGIGGLGLVRATCFNPDGTSIKDPAYQPCNQVTGSISQCCGTNHTGGAVAVDRCLANGLCQNTGDNGYLRGGCTDRAFTSEFCLNVCLTEDGGSSSDNAPLKLCVDGSWCCSSNNSNCCLTSSLKFNLAATVGVTSTTTSIQLPTFPAKTASPTTSSSSSSTAIALTSPPPETKKTNLVGVFVGVPVGLLLVGGIIGFFIYVRRRESKRLQLGPETSVSELAEGGSRWTKRFEMDGKSRPVELQGDIRGRFELPS